MSDPIELDDSDSASEESNLVTVVKKEPQISEIRSRIGEKQKVASTIRLTKKDTTETDIPAATKQYLAKKTGLLTNKPTVITFRITVQLQHGDGRMTGTMVPFQTKTFQTSDVSLLNDKDIQY